MLFINTFLSYVILMLVIAAVGGVAIAIGIHARKKKNMKITTDGDTEQK